MVEGLTLGIGAATALGLALLSSRSLVERVENPTDKQIDDFVGKLWKLRQRSPYVVVRKSPILDPILRNAAITALKIGWTPEEVQKLQTKDLLEVFGNMPGVDDPENIDAVMKKVIQASPENVRWLSDQTRETTSTNVYSAFKNLLDLKKGKDIDELLEMSKPISLLSLGTRLSHAKKFKETGLSVDDVRWLADRDLSTIFMRLRADDPESYKMTQKALKLLVKKHWEFDGYEDAYYFTDPKKFLEFASMDVKDIPPREYRIFPGYHPSGGYDWKEYEAKVKEFWSMPRKELDQMGIQADQQMFFWKESKKNEGLKSSIYAIKAIRDAVSTPQMRSFTEGLVSRILDSAQYHHEQNLAQFEDLASRLAALLKSGMLKKLNDTMVEYDEHIPIWKYEDTLMRFLAHGKNIYGWSSYGDLMEKLDLEIGIYPSSGKRSKDITPEDKILRRTRDRLAARDPEWAISQFSNEYERGKRIAPVIKEMVDRIEEMTRRGDTVVIHGRDGELLYDTLMRRPGIDRRKVRYAITSRPLTTQAHSIPVEYRDYLGRMVPKNAIHIDTGFAGSIPRWLDKEGFQIKSIQMVSADKKEEEIPLTIPMTDRERRDLVLNDLEHSSQRLENPPNSGWGQLFYAWGSPGYHARKFGVYDALGIPRLREKTPATRYEERRQFRIADEPAAVEVEESEEIELPSEKAYL